MTCASPLPLALLAFCLGVPVGFFVLLLGAASSDELRRKIERVWNDWS